MLSATPTRRMQDRNDESSRGRPNAWRSIMIGKVAARTTLPDAPTLSPPARAGEEIEPEPVTVREPFFVSRPTPTIVFPSDFPPPPASAPA
jgi:hypothetical protein